MQTCWHGLGVGMPFRDWTLQRQHSFRKVIKKGNFVKPFWQITVDLSFRNEHGKLYGLEKRKKRVPHPWESNARWSLPWENLSSRTHGHLCLDAFWIELSFCFIEGQAYHTIITMHFKKWPFFQKDFEELGLGPFLRLLCFSWGLISYSSLKNGSASVSTCWKEGDMFGLWNVHY